MESLLIWLVAALFGAAILGVYVARFHSRHRVESARRREAVALGADRPTAQYPLVDELRCIGCGSCVAACPEQDVLGIVAGRAVIINGLRCIGHGRCAEACPVGAIRVGLGDVGQRDDVPTLSPTGETNGPGVFIAGELSGFALIRNAVDQGRSVVEAIAQQLAAAPDGCAGGARGTSRVWDVVIVGAGPAGLSAALAARQARLSCVLLEQEQAGGTILQYPRKKIVLTQPVEIPLYGWLDRSEYTKEELLELWRDAEHRFELDVRSGHKLENVVRVNGHLEVHTTAGIYAGRRVVLALGRRGIPRKLGVPGEELPKVMYKLIDADSYRGERLLVVGGGDSAIEAAVGLSRQPGNQVTISYRKERFFRIKKRNEEKLAEALKTGALTTVMSSELLAILPDHVRIHMPDGERQLANDYVFIFAGGEPPWPLLRRIGIAPAAKC